MMITYVDIHILTWMGIKLSKVWWGEEWAELDSCACIYRCDSKRTSPKCHVYITMLHVHNIINMTLYMYIKILYIYLLNTILCTAFVPLVTVHLQAPLHM